MRAPTSILIAGLTLAGCAASPDATFDGDKSAIGDMESVESEDASNPLVAELTRRYGVRPRIYSGFWNRSNEAEEIFLDLLPEMARYQNGVLAARGAIVRVTEPELAVNFISEGGFFPLDQNRLTDLNSFGMGVDTLYDNRVSLGDHVEPGLRARLETLPRTVDLNERNEPVTTVEGLSLREALWANAGIFAWSKARAERDLEAEGETMSALPEAEQFFWTTVYFNAGIGRGRELLQSEGVGWHEQPWPLADDHGTYWLNARFNALWRTASFEYLRRTRYDD